MKHWTRFRFRSQRSKAFSALELIVVIVSVASILILLALALRPQKRPRTQCINNVKMVAFALRTWANDHTGQFPWDVTTNAGGSKELVGTGRVFAHFKSASNELNTPKILVCPDDRHRSFVPTRDAINVPVFNFISNSNVSYFVGVDAQKGEPGLLTGDRHITTNGTLKSGTLQIQTASDLKWAPALHPWGGNLATADGKGYQIKAGSTNLPSLVFPALLEIP